MPHLHLCVRLQLSHILVVLFVRVESGLGLNVLELY